MKTVPASRFRIFLALFFLLQSVNSYSQSNTINAYAVFSDSARNANMLLGTVYVQQLDTANTAQLEVRVGVTENDSSLVNVLVDFDNPGTLPSGFAYHRILDDVRIDVTGTLPTWTYFCRLRVKDLQGNWSQPFLFLAN